MADIRRSLEFYRDRLGFAEMMRLNNDDGSLWLVYLRITDTQFLELFPAGRVSAPLARSDRRSTISACKCDDLDVTAARLREAGIQLTVEPKMGLDGNRQCWIEDPDGNRIEFMQMSPDSMQTEAIRRLQRRLNSSPA